MTGNEKFRLRRRAFWRRVTGFLTDDFAAVCRVGSTVLFLVVWIILRIQLASVDEEAFLSVITQAVMRGALLVYSLAGGVIVLFVWLYPYQKKDIKDRLQSIALVNHAGMVPELVRKRQDPQHPRVTIWEFRNYGIPLTTWEDQQLAIEATLDISIVKMKYAMGKTRILLYAVPAKSDLPDIVKWREELLAQDSFLLVLGEGMLGPVSVNLAHIPHILLGGSTGSGKSVLLKLLLMQCLCKGAKVYISDFKGGVDFPPIWHDRCHMCFDEQNLLELLTSLVDELQYRKEILRAAGCPNVDEYNKMYRMPLQRCIFACDEVAEVLDKAGRTKEQKELVGKIESKLSIIARQGRAFGIHLILATQRPDANILPGQIKNNMDCRICGRADNVLSQIILDRVDAADQIPKDARGRFLMQDGTIFQAYWFDEETI